MTRPRPAFALLLGIATLSSSAVVRAADAPAAAAPAAPRTFASADDAGKALAAAFAANDDQALRAVLGAGSEALVEKGEDPLVAETRKRIASDAKTKLAVDRVGEGRATLLLGDDGWPFPIPLVRDGDAWRFDVEAGREEVRARQVGRHELEVIGVCRAYLDMQAAYAAKDRDGDEVREYAQRVRSSAGTHDGLWWPDATEDDPPPLGVPLVPLKRAGQDDRSPYAGYFWRILKGQGASAPGGAHTYVLNGNMIAGFALVAVPAEYRKTGVMTFLVSHHGKVFQKDLGPTSLDVVRAMDVYDPDATWEAVEPGQETVAPGAPSAAPPPQRR